MRQTETHYLQTGFDVRKLVAIFLITAGCGDDLDDDVANELFLTIRLWNYWFESNFQ